MRKIAEKVALVAQICVAIVFVIVAMLYVLGFIPQVALQNNTVVFVVMAVLATIFVGTSAYLLYMNFSQLQNLKRILLYADSKCATTTTVRVVNKIAGNCADKIDGIHIKKTRIRADEKQGYVATFIVEVSATSVTPALEQLRCLIEDSFKETLGLTFNTITFEVAKLTSEPVANVQKAKQRAQTITDSVDVVQDMYQNPTGEQTTTTDKVISIPIDEPTDVAVEEPTDTDVTDDEQVTDATDQQGELPADETSGDEKPNE